MSQETLEQTEVIEAVAEDSATVVLPPDAGASDPAPIDVKDLMDSLLGWRDELIDTLEQMSAESFERLILRVLDKDGVSGIELSSANDTIEGMGVFGGGGFLSFRVSFRCIRGGGRISSAEVDDFRRGVMVSRADKGLLITTGKFTQEAALKAASERAPEIRLIDGEELTDKLKDLQLGVRTEQVVVEQVLIDKEWLRDV